VTQCMVRYLLCQNGCGVCHVIVTLAFLRGAVALVPGTDENGNNVYSARIINGRYIFTKDIAYRTLTYDEMEEQRKNPKKQRVR